MKWHRAKIEFEDGDHKSRAFDSKAQAEDYIAKVIESKKAKKIKISNFKYPEKQKEKW